MTARCSYAGCKHVAVYEDREGLFCAPHYTEHLAFLREQAERSCRCGQRFVSTNPRRVLCSNCRRAGRRAS